MYIIPNEKGEKIETDEAGLRKYALKFSPEKGRKAFKQDFRLLNAVRTKPISEVFELLEKQGADVQQI